MGTVTQSQRSDHCENWLQPPCLQGRIYQRTWTKPGLQLWPFSGHWCYGSTAIRGWGRSKRPPPPHVKRLPLWQHEGQKSARAWVIQRLKSSLSSFPCEGLARWVQRHLQHVRATLLPEGQRTASPWPPFTHQSSHHFIL